MDFGRVYTDIGNRTNTSVVQFKVGRARTEGAEEVCTGSWGEPMC
ncbi:MAG: hypothetical protein ACREOW_16885 [Thermodesulfobacteriota bacterium]